MTKAEDAELAIREAIDEDDYRKALDLLIEFALPVVSDTAKHTLLARKAQRMDPVDTLTLSNELVELSILNQRVGDRVSLMGYIVRAAKEYYERVREGHKVRLTQEGIPKQVTEKINDTGGEKIVTKFTTVAAGVADSMKVDLSHDEFKIYNECELMMDKLVYTRKSTDKTMDSIRTKISYEKSNERNA